MYTDTAASGIMTMPPSFKTSKKVLSLCFGAAACSALLLRRGLFRPGCGLLCLRIRHERKESKQDDNRGDAENGRRRI